MTSVPQMTGVDARPASAPRPARLDPNAVWCGHLELSTEAAWPARPATAAGAGYPAARILVRLHGEPLGYVRVSLAGGVVDPYAARAVAFADLGDRIRAHLAADGRPDALTVPAGALPAMTSPIGDGAPACGSPMPDDLTVSVVVCTRDRADTLRPCLDALSALTWPHLEIIVVDNAPTDDSTRVAVERARTGDPRLRYVREDAPGLSRARNAGLAAATGDVVAYTDDDVQVDPDWITGIARGFGRRDDVACVTGLVASESLDSPAERYFDARVSWATSCLPRIYDMRGDERPSPLHPYAAGAFGTGANFAFRTSTLRAMGGFDEALGAGTLTAGGEDLDIFVRTLLGGHALAYEPSALVRHSHRSDVAGLRRQMFGYGSGLSAYLCKYLAARQSRADILRNVRGGLRHMRSLDARTRDVAETSQTVAAPLPAALRHELRLRELAGVAAGPVLYIRSLRTLRTP